MLAKWIKIEIKLDICFSVLTHFYQAITSYLKNVCYSLRLINLLKFKQASEVYELLQLVEDKSNCDVGYPINPTDQHIFLGTKTAKLFLQTYYLQAFIAQSAK